MDLRTGPSADEGRTRPRSLRRSILAGPSPTRAHDDDRLWLPPASPPRNGGAGKKESTDHHPNPACLRCEMQSSTSSFDRYNGARTADDRSAGSGLKQICQSSASDQRARVDPYKSPTIAPAIARLESEPAVMLDPSRRVPQVAVPSGPRSLAPSQPVIRPAGV
jgi:hypothetical protein